MTATLEEEPDGPPRGTALLLHGFTRSPEDLADLSAGCLALGARTLRPGLGALWWPTSTNNAGFLTRVADDVAGRVADGPVVVVGHSAGASAGAWVAARLRQRGVEVTTLVLVDGVESPTHLIERAWPGLSGVRVLAACAPPSRCNRGGALARWLAGRVAPDHVVVVPDAGHGDIEGPSRAVYRWACGDDPRRPAGTAVLDIVLGWVGEGLRGARAGATQDP